VASVSVFRKHCYPQNQTKYITYRFSTGEPWDPGTVAEHLGESTTFQRFSCSCITGNTTEPFKSHVPAVTSKAWSKGLSSGWTREGHSCSRQPLPNPSSSHATTKAGSSPGRKSLQSTPAPRPGDIFTSLCDVTSECVRCSMHVFNRMQRRQRCPLQRRQGGRTMCDLRRRAISVSWCCYF